MARPSYASKNMVAETQKSIYDAAVKLFAKNGYTETKTQQIANIAGVNKAMLHYYYETKENLFRQLVSEGLAIFDSAVDKSASLNGTTEETIKTFIKTYFTNLSYRIELSQIIFREIMSGSEAVGAEVKTRFIKSFRRLAEVIDPSQELTHKDSIFLAYTLFGMAGMFVAGHFVAGRELDADKLSEEITKLFLNGARAK